MEFREDRGAEAELQRRIDALLARVARSVAADARDTCPRGDGPGPHTADTIEAVGNRVYVGDGHDPLWFWLEYGTREHWIPDPDKPRRKQALFWEGTDHPVRRVHHPGTREYAYMRTALYQRRRVTLP